MYANYRYSLKKIYTVTTLTVNIKKQIKNSYTVKTEF